MSTTTSIQAEASKPQQNQQHQQKKMQECRRCKAVGFPNQLIGFKKVREDPIAGKISWKLIDENRQEHKHKFITSQSSDNNNNVFKSRQTTDIATVSDIAEARRFIAVGWEYKTSYASIIANIPYYVLVKREQYN